MKKIYPIIVIVVLAGAGFFFRDDLEKHYFQLTRELREFKQLALNSIETEAQREVIAPPPLRSEEEAAVSNLTKAGVIEWTNRERERNGLPGLGENQKLSQAARAKVEDMFRRQYFDHISPDGKGPADLAESARYEYLAVGENLALGNFENDQALVRAWMESPGHRENILHSGFSEIGVAVEKGIFEGKTIWLAVQEFGRPLSACPKADAELKNEIDANIRKIEALKSMLDSEKKEIEKSSPAERTRKEIEDYNDLVKDYNSLVEETKDLIALHNRQVRRFNECVRQK